MADVAFAVFPRSCGDKLTTVSRSPASHHQQGRDVDGIRGVGLGHLSPSIQAGQGWEGGQAEWRARPSPERKPEEVEAFPLDLDIVHFTGEAAVVNLGSPVIVQAALARKAPPLC